MSKDEITNLFETLSSSLDIKAWQAYKEERYSDLCRELAAAKSDLDSLIRIAKLKLKEIENELIA